jgi:hypothetical protein
LDSVPRVAAVGRPYPGLLSGTACGVLEMARWRARGNGRDRTDETNGIGRPGQIASSRRIADSKWQMADGRAGDFRLGISKGAALRRLRLVG